MHEFGLGTNRIPGRDSVTTLLIMYTSTPVASLEAIA